MGPDIPDAPPLQLPPAPNPDDDNDLRRQQARSIKQRARQSSFRIEPGTAVALGNTASRSPLPSETGLSIPV